MLSTTLLRSLFKNHLNMRQHQLKLSPVSDSASIPIQEETPRQRKSWLNWWENSLLPFRDQFTCAGKDYQGPLTAIALQKTIFWPQWVSAGARGNKCSHFAGSKGKTPSSPPPRQNSSARTVSPRKQQCPKKILAKQTTESSNISSWVISTVYFLGYSTWFHGGFEGEKVWRSVQEKLLSWGASSKQLNKKIIRIDKWQPARTLLLQRK